MKKLVEFLRETQQRVGGAIHLYQAEPRLVPQAPEAAITEELEAYQKKGGTLRFFRNGNDLVGFIAMRVRDWDTRFLGFPVGSIDYAILRPSFLGEARSIFEDALRQHGFQLVSTRVALHDVETAQCLEKMGFRLIETYLCPTRLLTDRDLEIPDTPEVKWTHELSHREEESVLAAASRMFQGHPSRFFSDPYLKHRAPEFFQIWTRNLLANPEIGITLVREDETVLGFILWKIEGWETPLGKVFDWILAGVDPGARGKGIGTILYRGTVKRCRELGGGIFHSAVSAANYPIVRVYVKIDASFPYGAFTLHWWRD